MSPTITLGLDLASQPENTGLCAVEWHDDHAEVVTLFRGADDAVLGLAMHGHWGLPTKIGIDAPLGWPVDFVRAVSDPASWPVSLGGDRKRLERRATDFWVHDVASKLPLSVTTDRIAYAAMRAAGLLAHLATSGETIDRSGMTGRVCETYPDPAIRRLGLWPTGAGARDSYKGAALDVRERIVRGLVERAPWLQLAPEQQAACIESDDCLDALVCALVDRAAERGLTVAPPSELEDEARSEGWIHLPAADMEMADLL